MRRGTPYDAPRRSARIFDKTIANGCHTFEEKEAVNFIKSTLESNTGIGDADVCRAILVPFCMYVFGSVDAELRYDVLEKVDGMIKSPNFKGHAEAFTLGLKEGVGAYRAGERPEEPDDATEPLKPPGMPCRTGVSIEASLGDDALNFDLRDTDDTDILLADLAYITNAASSLWSLVSGVLSSVPTILKPSCVTLFFGIVSALAKFSKLPQKRQTKGELTNLVMKTVAKKVMYSLGYNLAFFVLAGISSWPAFWHGVVMVTTGGPRLRFVVPTLEDVVRWMRTKGELSKVAGKGAWSYMTKQVPSQVFWNWWKGEMALDPAAANSCRYLMENSCQNIGLTGPSQMKAINNYVQMIYDHPVAARAMKLLLEIMALPIPLLVNWWSEMDEGPLEEIQVLAQKIRREMARDPPSNDVPNYDMALYPHEIGDEQHYYYYRNKTRACIAFMVNYGLVKDILTYYDEDNVNDLLKEDRSAKLKLLTILWSLKRLSRVAKKVNSTDQLKADDARLVCEQRRLLQHAHAPMFFMLLNEEKIMNDGVAVPPDPCDDLCARFQVGLEEPREPEPIQLPDDADGDDPDDDTEASLERSLARKVVLAERARSGAPTVDAAFARLGL